MNYKIQVPSSGETFVDAMSLLIEPSLTKQEKRFLAYLLHLNIDYKQLPMDKRMSFILSSSTRKSIAKDLDLKGTQISNLIKSLQKKKLFEEPILEEDRLNKHLDIPGIPDNIIFALIKEVHEEEEPRRPREDSKGPQLDSGTSGDLLETLGSMDQIEFTFEGQDDPHNEYREANTE
jgi:DNA-binding MarR family transcriptional regulator